MKQRTLQSNAVRFVRDEHWQLFCLADGKRHGPLRMKRAFPLTDPDHHVLVTLADGSPFGVLHDVTELDDASRSVVEEALDRAYFLPRIVSIGRIEDELGAMVWEVETDRGPRTFHVVSQRRDIRWLSDQHLVVEDADGNRYEITDLDSMDPASRDTLEMVL